MITIYALLCLHNGKAYIGSTKSKPRKRLREHLCLLRSQSHKCCSLQSDWNMFGPSSLALMRLETIDSDDVDKRREAELKWMDRYSIWLYNEHRISMRPTDEAIRKGVANAHKERGNRWTPEVNEKRRQAQLGIPKCHGAKISATKRANREQVMR